MLLLNQKGCILLDLFFMSLCSCVDGSGPAPPPAGEATTTATTVTNATAEAYSVVPDTSTQPIVNMRPGPPMASGDTTKPMVPGPPMTPGDKTIVKHETNLLDDLIGNYSSGMRPVRSSKTPAVIRFALTLNKLVKLDTKEQVLVIDAFVVMHWTDPQLRWNSSDYNETSVVNIESTKVWTPDVVLYNTADDTGKSHMSIYSAPVIVNSTGDIVWMNAVTLKASCDIEIKWFPIDTQNCPLKFGSWSYPARRLQVDFEKQPQEKAELEGSNFVSNGVWNFVNFTSSLSLRKFSCCELAYSQIEYKFELARRPTFFFLYLIFPCLAIVILAFFSFVIPPEAGERIGFSVTVILSFSVYLIVISDKLPERSDSSPLLGILYVLIFYLLVLTFVMSAINVRLYFNKYRPPQWLFSLADSSETKGSLFGKRLRFWKTSNIKPSDPEHEMEKKEGMAVEEMKQESSSFSPAYNDSKSDLYKTQWEMISAYLDKLSLKIVVVLFVAAPILVVYSI